MNSLVNLDGQKTLGANVSSAKQRFQAQVGKSGSEDAINTLRKGERS